MAFILRPPSTPPSLRERLGSLAQWRRIWAIAGGLGSVLAFGSLLLAGALLLDLGFTLPAFVRAVLLGAFLAGLGGILSAMVITPWRQRASSLELALSLERRNPHLNDALASAVAFQQAEADDTQEFRDAAVRHAERLAEPLNWSAVLPLARFWKAFWLAALGALCLMAISLLFADRMPTAIQRFFHPWGHNPWPARTTIMLDPFAKRLAVGDPWALSFTVRGELPEAARVQFRSGAIAVEDHLPLSHETDNATASLKLDASRTVADFQFRVLANDGDTGWHFVSVAPPPRLVNVDGHPSPRLQLQYPHYTGWQPLELPDGTTVVEAVVGTRITLTAQTDRPVAHAALVYLGDRTILEVPQALAPIAALPDPMAAMLAAELVQEFTREIPVVVSGADRCRLSASFTLPQSGLFALRFMDDSGLTGQRLLDLRAFSDPAPTCTLVRPDPQRDTLDLQESGSFPFETRADDRIFANRTLTLEYRINGGPWQSRSLFDGAVLEDAMPALTGYPVDRSASHPVTVSHVQRLALSSFRSPDGRALAAGDTLTLRAAATDWDDVTIAKAPGCSAEVLIRVQSPPSLEAELQRRLAALRDPLQKAAEAQADAAAKTKANALEAAERSQAAVRNRIADPQDGLRARVARMQSMALDNKLPESAATSRLEAVARALARLDEKQLPAIEAAQAAARKAPAAREDLAKKQDAAARDLKTTAEELGRWAGVAELQSEAQALSQQVRKAREGLNALQERLPPGVRPEDLPAADRAALEATAADLAAAEARMKKLLDQTEQVRQAKKPGSPAEAERLDNAMQAAGGQSATDALREAAAETRDNRIKAADANRAKAETRLKAFEDALAGRDVVPSADELRKKAQDRADQIDELKKKQAKLAEQAAAATEPDAKAKLAEEQASLAREAERLAEDATAGKQPESAEALQRAAQKMDQAADELNAGHDGAKAAAEASRELQKAQEQAQPKAEPKPNDLAREQQEQLLKSLTAFRDRQQAAIGESQRLSTASAAAGRWERPLTASLVSLADREEALAKELKTWKAKAVKDAPVFERLLDRAVEQMEQAAVRLRERKDDALTATTFEPESEAAADEVVRRPMLEALRRLNAIVEALTEKPRIAIVPAGEATPGAEKPPQAAEGGKAGTAPPLAQLKALRDWQAEIESRTAAFTNAHPDPEKFSDDDRAELSHLQKAQQEIAELFETLRESLTPKPEVP